MDRYKKLYLRKKIRVKFKERKSVTDLLSYSEREQIFISLSEFGFPKLNIYLAFRSK